MTDTQEKKPSAVLGPMRIPFLTLVPACIVLGAATAYLETGSLNWLYLVLALVGGLAAHVGVNSLNEYDDFKSGLDMRTERTPFSGGSGALPDQPEKARYALITGMVALALLLLIGIYFVVQWGWAIAPLGLLGILVIVAYTPAMTRSPLLCLLAPGLGFGIFMVNGTHFALTGQYSVAAFLASLAPFFLVSNLLLMNQFPDLEADRASGRKHLIIAHGTRAGVRAFGLFLAACYVALLLSVLLGPLPYWALLGLLTLPLGAQITRGLSVEKENIPALIPFMGKNILLTHAIPLLMALGIFIG